MCDVGVDCVNLDCWVSQSKKSGGCSQVKVRHILCEKQSKVGVVDLGEGFLSHFFHPAEWNCVWAWIGIGCIGETECWIEV